MKTAYIRESGRDCKRTYFPSHAHIRWPSHNRSVVLTTRCTHTTLGLSANKCICLLVARINSIFYGRRRLPLVGSLRMESTRYRLLVPRDSEVLRFYHSYAIVIVSAKIHQDIYLFRSLQSLDLCSAYCWVGSCDAGAMTAVDVAMIMTSENLFSICSRRQRPFAAVGDKKNPSKVRCDMLSVDLVVAVLRYSVPQCHFRCECFDVIRAW